VICTFSRTIRITNRITMPKTIKLSWQPGVGDRQGRWRKIYRGKAYHFPGGKGKSDREGYDAAWAAWELLKAKIDRESPRKHQQAYYAAIDEWEQVLAWSNRYGEREFAEIATRKLGSLRTRFASPVLPPLDRLDRLEACLGGSLPLDPNWLAEIQKLTEENNERPAWGRIESFFRGPDARTPKETEAIDKLVQVDQLLGEIASSSQGPSPRPLIQPSDNWVSPGRIAREIWQDRVRFQKREAASEDQSLKTHIEKYVGRKEKHGNAGQISAGRGRTTKLHLTSLETWLGRDFDEAKIDEQVLAGFHEYLLDKIASKTWSETTASDCMASVKSFVRWMWITNAIPTLPRILDGKSRALKITKPKPKVVTFTKEEIRTLLADASARTRLFILLMLNCAHTQKDISDLQVTEVDWREGRIVRKRSKTADCENVPTVNYLLWPETLRLLKQERSANSEGHVLLNANGSPIWSEEITKEGRYKKSDNIKSAFARLQRKVGITKPLKSLKKTSASLLRNNEKFSTLASLFLGHAPKSISDRHYTQVPQNLFDQAVTWLGQEYGLVTPAEKPKAEESASKPSDSVPATETSVSEQAPKPRSKPRPSRAGRRFDKSKSRRFGLGPALSGVAKLTSGHQPDGNPQQPGVTNSTELPAGSRK